MVPTHVAALIIGILGLIFSLLAISIFTSHLLNVSNANNEEIGESMIILLFEASFDKAMQYDFQVPMSFHLYFRR